MKSFIDRVKSDKLLFFLSVLIIGLFLVLIIRITYSYLAASINEAGNNVTMGSDKTDELNFIKGDNLVLNATPTTLPEGGANYVDTTTYSASLKANSTNKTANYTYYVYFNIPTNTINYIEENTPEVILTISQGDNEITNINGLTYGTYNGVSGFDITNKSGSFNIASDYLITSNSSENATIQDWTFTLTYLNQNYDQSANYGNSMNVEIIMRKDEIDNTLATYIKNLYTDGSNGLYYHDANLANGAEDNSYRYAGANPNNYVCFGSDAETCPEDNLYRIIGVFGDEVKLISTKILSDFTLDSSADVNSESLITSYVIDAVWENKILNHEWKIGNVIRDTSYTVKQYYEAELNRDEVTNAKIGAMYISDYGYATSPEYWTTPMFNYSLTKNSNWMYVGVKEWTISTENSTFGWSFFIDVDGNLYSLERQTDGSILETAGIRAVFYLSPSTLYLSGDGTQSNPIRIN